MQTDHMYIMKSCNGESFQQGQLSRYGKIELSPSAGVLNYGQVKVPSFLSLSVQGIDWYCLSTQHLMSATNSDQGLFEGTKAYRREDGCLFLFRPDQNAIRMQIGAERMCMPSPSVEQFVNAVKQTALANRRWVTPLFFIFSLLIPLMHFQFITQRIHLLPLYVYFPLLFSL